MNISFRLLALTACLTTTAAAQDAPAPVAEALRGIAHRSGKNLIAAAEEMPGGKYSFKPTPAQMTFGDVISHLSQGNDYLCSKIGGVPAPKRAELAKEAPKEKLVARLRETFDFCNQTLGKLTDTDLGGKVPFFGEREVSRAEAMFAAAEDWADHYSQLAIYLRLNGLLPPTAKRRQQG